jgi:hypothetical protein
MEVNNNNGNGAESEKKRSIDNAPSPAVVASIDTTKRILGHGSGQGDNTATQTRVVNRRRLCRWQVISVYFWPVILSWAMLWVPLGGWQCLIPTDTYWPCDQHVTYTNITEVQEDGTIVVIGVEESAPAVFHIYIIYQQCYSVATYLVQFYLWDYALPGTPRSHCCLLCVHR